MSSPVDVVLFKLPQEWGLPSLSLASIYVEVRFEALVSSANILLTPVSPCFDKNQAFLRLSEVRFATQDCPTTTSSPTGQIPSLDVGNDLLEITSDPTDEGIAAHSAIKFLQWKFPAKDVDRKLSPSERAESVAFLSLIHSHLLAALEYSTWCESEAYNKYTRPAYARGLPFPLSYLSPRSQQKAVQRRYSKYTSSQIYDRATLALEALAAKLEPSGGNEYLLGVKPSSVDAALYACLAYIRGAPLVHSELKKILERKTALRKYVERMSEELFSSAAPTAADSTLTFSEYEASAGSGEDERKKNEKKKKGKSEVELAMERKGRLWLLGVAAVIVGYAVLGGQYFQIGYFEEEDEEQEQLD